MEGVETVDPALTLEKWNVMKKLNNFRIKCMINIHLKIYIKELNYTGFLVKDKKFRAETGF